MRYSNRVWNLVQHRVVNPATTSNKWFSTSTIVSSSTDGNTHQKQQIIPEITLYQYQICPFCNIVKSCLNYNNQPYKAIEVNPLTRAEIKWSKNYNKVPIVTIIGDTRSSSDDDKNKHHYFGSDEIVSGLLSMLSSSPPPPPTTTSDNDLLRPKKPKNNEKWTEYATNELAPLLYPNLCNTLNNSYRAFDYVHQVDSFSTIQRYSIQSIGSRAMYFAASKIKRKFFLFFHLSFFF